jgi:chemotaxis protein MotB
MQKYSIITFIAFFLYSTTVLKAETPPVSSLSDGIAAFICDEIDNINDVPLIFIKDESNWNLSGSSELSVNKIENGFKLKSSGDEEGFGFLKKISRTQWNFEYLDQKGFYETSCIPQDYFVDLLIEHISPKIIDNGNILADEILDLNEALAQAMNTADLRAKEISLLSDVLSETEKKRLAEAATAAATAGFLREKLKASSNELTSSLLAKSKLEAENINNLNEKNAIELALASARNEINEQMENARLAAAKREALELLIVKIRNESELNLVEAKTLLSRETASKKWWIDLSNSLQAKVNSLNSELSNSKNYALLKKEKDISSLAQRKLALLNTQTSQLRNQLNELQGLLDESKEADTKAQIQLKSLGTDLNLALARVAAEQRKIAELEAKEKLRYAEEAKDLRKFRSQFFGELRKVMEGQEGVRIVGDRFVFSSDVLFSVGSANLGSLAKTEINKVAKIINQIAGEIPDGIDWILRVDGHTDRIPFSGFGKDYKDNWELSQARALSVVRYLMDDLKIPANRLAANGFGEFQPIDDRDTPEAYKTNRRIELKFTEK